MGAPGDLGPLLEQVTPSWAKSWVRATVQVTTGHRQQSSAMQALSNRERIEVLGREIGMLVYRCKLIYVALQKTQNFMECFELIWGRVFRKYMLHCRRR